MVFCLYSMGIKSKKQTEPAFFRELGYLWLFVVLIRSWLWLFSGIALLSMLEVFFPLPAKLLPYYGLAGLVALLTHILLKKNTVPGTIMTMARNIFSRNPAWLPFSPVVVRDIFQGRVFAQESEKRELQVYCLQKNHSLRGLPLQAWYTQTSLPSLHLPALVSAILFLLAFSLSISPWRIANFNRHALLSEVVVRISPPGGEWFSGSEMKIHVKVIDPQYSLAYVVLTKADKEQTILSPPEKANAKVLSAKLENVRQNFSLQAHLKRGLFSYKSGLYSFKVREPAGIKTLVHTVYPPTYTGISPYTTSEPFFRMFYGSQVTMRAELDSLAKLRLGKNISPKVSREHRISQVFTSDTPMKMQYAFISTRDNAEIETYSPEYEFVPAIDSPPYIQMDGLPETGLELKIPESGNVQFSYTATDDFALREVGVIIFRGKSRQKIPLTLNKIKKDDVGRYVYTGKVSIQRKYLTDKEVTLQLFCRDNSLIPSRYSWEKIPQKGQIAISQTIRILNPDGSAQKEEWIERQAKEDALAIQSLAEKYAESEKEMKDLAERARRGEKVDDEATKWAHERKQLQSEAKNLAKSPLFRDKNAEKDEISRSAIVKKTLESLLDEKISATEEQLKKLLRDMPQDYMAAKKEIKKMSKEEYLHSLQNSVIHLKKLMALKELRELKNSLSEWEKDIVKNQEKLLTKNQDSATRKATSDNYKNKTKQAITKSEKVDKEYGTKSSPDSNLQKHLENNAEKTGSGNTSKEDIENLSTLRKSVVAWKNEIEKEMEKNGNAEQEKAVQALRAAALRVQQVSDVLEVRSIKDRQNTPSKSAETVVQLRDSFRNVFVILSNSAGNTGFIPPDIAMQAKETDDFFQETSASAENNHALTFKSNAERLRWKLNRLSLALLKEMGNMRMQMAGMTGQGLQSAMGGEGASQADKETLRKMGQEQSGKDGDLTPEERAFMEDAARRMAEQSEKIKALSRKKELEGTTASKEAMSMATELKKDAERAQRLKQRKEVAELSADQKSRDKKYLKAERSLRQKETESNERQADVAREYNLSPVVKQTPEKKNTIIEYFDQKNISDSKKLFLDRFRKNYLERGN